MKILMCLIGYFPPDIRVEKEARTLARAGHEVFLLCKGKPGQAAREKIESLQVIRVSREKRLGLWWDHAAIILTARYPFWQKQIQRIVQHYGIEAVHVHDLPLVNTAYAVTRRFGIPLVADLHEIYSEAVRVWATGSWIRYAHLLARWELHEKKCFRNATSVIVVSPEIAEYYQNKFHIPEGKLSYLMNVVDLEYFESIPINSAIVEKLKNDFTIISSGNTIWTRGLNIAVNALPAIAAAISNIKLLIVGPITRDTIESWLRPGLSYEAIEKYLVIVGWQEYLLFPSYIAGSDVGILPFLTTTPQADLSSPNRLFEYMGLGKPVIVSDARSLKRIIDKTGAGLVFEAGNVEAFAEAVIRLATDKDLYNRLSAAARAAVQSRYNWEIEGLKLVKLYERLR